MRNTVGVLKDLMNLAAICAHYNEGVETIALTHTMFTGALTGRHRPFPYSSWEKGKVKVHGLPRELHLKTFKPSDLGKRDLEAVLAGMDQIIITGMCPHLTEIYCRAGLDATCQCKWNCKKK